jgi:hypothetical protein
METHKHYIKFVFSEYTDYVNGIEKRTRKWDATCPECLEDLKEKGDIKAALCQIYSPEIADAVYEVFELKNSYYWLVEKLQRKGVENPLEEVRANDDDNDNEANNE